MSDRWPDWARPQLRGAVLLAAAPRPPRPLATELYERWFAGTATTGPTVPGLAGAYRRAHAEAATFVVDGVPVLQRADRIGADGWWRTWNTTWRPRRNGTRVLLSPRVEAAPAVVATLTGALRDVPYLLACPTDARRLAGSGGIVLYVPRWRELTGNLFDALRPQLRADTPPLCLPVAPGIAVAEYPDNGMTFGEHRCHLVAMALGAGPAGARREPALDAIATVFRAHGIDPARPYCAAR